MADSAPLSSPSTPSPHSLPRQVVPGGTGRPADGQQSLGHELLHAERRELVIVRRRRHRVDRLRRHRLGELLCGRGDGVLDSCSGSAAGSSDHDMIGGRGSEASGEEGESQRD